MLGENIKNLRIETNMTQDALAEELNVTRQAISKWENNKGEPDLNMLKNIAFILGVTVNDLISGDNAVRIHSVSKEILPNVRFIGKRYRANANYSSKWKDWIDNDWFSILENTENLYSNSYVGAKCIENSMLEYWIGMLFHPNAFIPKGFDCIDIPKVNLASLSLCGKAYKLTSFETHNLCLKEVCKAGMTRYEDHWCFECFDNKNAKQIGTEKIITMDYKISTL